MSNPTHQPNPVKQLRAIAVLMAKQAAENERVEREEREIAKDV
ncbi:hypothetical protein FHT87_005231 [Rhizobium sp. BK316]|nr:hypothetical protein [Rhizobium sp. BK316]MBB3411278.1 hypothetical protein [Rhizobium sp. BK316]